MRVYVATTPLIIRELLQTNVTFDEYLAPEQFEFDAQVGDEEREHLISLLAADDAIALNQGRVGYVLALDLNEAQLDGGAIKVDFNQVAAVLQSEDGEELTWYAPEEVKFLIDSWIS